MKSYDNTPRTIYADTIPDHYYDQAEMLLNMVKAFEQSICQCVYILDHYRRCVFHISENIEHLCGMKPDDIKKMGYRFFSEFISDQDLKMLKVFKEKAYEAMNSYQETVPYDFLLSAKFHIKYNNEVRLVSHKWTPFVLSDNGKLWLELCTVSLATGRGSGHLVLKRKGSTQYQQYCYNSNRWIQHNEITVTDMERKVLQLSSQGYTMREISEKVCRSIDSVKGYKRSIFDKMDVANIVEAVTFARNHKLI